MIQAAARPIRAA